MCNVNCGEFQREVPFPYPDDRFPAELGAAVQRTVLDDAEPARYIAHDAEGYWLVGDGINDPSERGACVLTHMTHVVDLDPSVGDLAALPPGKGAWRDNRAHPWVIDDHVYRD